VCIGESFQECAMVTLKLLEMKVPKVLSRAHGDAEAVILQRIGAHEVLYVEQEMGKHWASLLARPGAIEDFEVARNYSIVRIPPDKQWMGKQLSELQLPKTYGITMLGSYVEDRFELVKGAETVIQPDRDI